MPSSRNEVVRTALIAIALGAAACGDDGAGVPDAAPPPAWDPRLPVAAEAFGERRGLTPVRGIIHLHSVYSHDACDGQPREDETGAIDTACLHDLQTALCATRIDVAALTDHDATMADDSFETMLGDLANGATITEGDDVVGGVLACPDGHQVLLKLGSENPLMPILMERHVDGTVEERRDLYNAETALAAAAMRAAGGLVWIPHTESRTIETLRTLAPDGLEIYNLHANIDPDIRSEYLGLPSAAAIQAVAEFADTGKEQLEPDLAVISFLAENQPAIERWHQLLGDGLRIPGSAGTDAHQNALPIMMRDGERGDSYRRMLRWFSNVALVDDPLSLESFEQAIAAGRFFVAFEILGTPSGFDVSAAGAEMGAEVAPGTAMTVTLPTVHDLDTALPAPDIRARVIHIAPGGTATEVAAGSGATLELTLDQEGAYRVEVLITPRHLAPYLVGLITDYSTQEHVWIYGNPIYVTAP